MEIIKDRARVRVVLPDIPYVHVHVCMFDAVRRGDHQPADLLETNKIEAAMTSGTSSRRKTVINPEMI